MKMVLMGVPVAESQITIIESGPASAVAIHRLSSLTLQHVIGLHCGTERQFHHTMRIVVRCHRFTCFRWRGGCVCTHVALKQVLPAAAVVVDDARVSCTVEHGLCT